MKVVDPNKLAIHRELIDAAVLQVCIERGVSRPEAYREVAKNDIGICLRLHSAGSGWWSGISHQPGKSLLGTPEDIRARLGSIRESMEMLSAALKAGDNEKIDRSKVDELGQELDLLQHTMPSSYAKEFLGRLVFAAKPESVCTALMLLSIEPTVDLFVDPFEFAELYPHSEWRRLIGSAVNLDRNQLDVPGQLYLLQNKELEQEIAFQQALRSMAARVALEGPLSFHTGC